MFHFTFTIEPIDCIIIIIELVIDPFPFCYFKFSLERYKKNIRGISSEKGK